MKPAEPVMRRVWGGIQRSHKNKFEKENAGDYLTPSFKKLLAIFLLIRNHQKH